MLKSILWTFVFLAGIFCAGGFSFDRAQAVATCESGTALVHGVCVPSDTGLPDKTVSQVLLSFMMWLLYILGTLAVIAFTISGIMYLTSAGNDGMIDKAKDYMIWSIVGVIVAFSSVIILTAVSSLLTGSTAF